MLVIRSSAARAGIAACAVSALVVVAAGALSQGAGEATGAPSHLSFTARAASSSIGGPVPLVVVDTANAVPGASAPPPPSSCGCYEPAQFQAAYDLAPLYAKGDTGKGMTIVIVDAYGSPTIKADLAAFDSGFGLAAPPSFKIVAPVGKIPPWTASSTRIGWATETTLDVEYSHAIAPGANILLLETPTNETEGAAGFKQITAAENWVLKPANHTGEVIGVISQSFGATEQTFGSNMASAIAPFRTAFQAADVAGGPTVLAAAGDDGVSGCTNVSCSSLYTKRVNSWPSSDPLVTSVGGLRLFISTSKPYKQTQAPVVWNDVLGGASGGGDSAVFPVQSFESGVSSIVGKWRGTPDVSMSAAAEGGAELYISFDGAQWTPVAGTSEASPEFAGIVAIADQVAGKPLGDLDPAIYAMGAAKNAGLVDVTSGNNSYNGVTGYTAVAGYDMASGWGTVNAAVFVPDLVAAVAKAG
jgi:subtilase family serine protease